MARLKDRNHQIPGGFKFVQPETKWVSVSWSSFDSIVTALQRHRLANPYLAQKHNWATDYDSVAFEVEQYNAKICEAHGWTNFIMLDDNPSPGSVDVIPKSKRPLLGGLKNVAVGAETIGDYLHEGSPEISHEQAEARASICVKCPKNGKGDWTTWFTDPLASAIREGVALFKGYNLTTSHDEELKVCTACNCPLPFLVHFPVEIKWKHMSPESKAALWEECWVRKEMGQTAPSRLELVQSRAAQLQPPNVRGRPFVSNPNE